MKKFLFGSLGVLAIVLSAFLIVSTVTIGYFSLNGANIYDQPTITVSGDAIVEQVPDRATIRFVLETTRDTVETAQIDNTEQANGLIAALKALDITEENLQTEGYSTYEKFEWQKEEGRQSVGWTVSQTLVVTVDDTERVSDVLALSGPHSVSNTYGPDFEVMADPDLEDARREALAEANMQAEQIEEELGVRLSKVVSYNEWVGGGFEEPYLPRSVFAESMALDSAAPAPVIEAGTEESTFNVSITYRVR